MREGWDTNPLGDLLIEASPGFACGDDLDTGIFQIRMNNLSSAGRLVLDKRRRVPANHKKVASTTLNPGDVLFNATNSPDLVGKSAFFGGCDEPAVYSNHFLRLRTQTDKLDPRYLSMWLQREFGRGYFKSKCKQWVNQATFGKDLLVKLPISLPPLEEQKRIASILDAADELRTKRQQAIDQLDTLTQAIFHDMFGPPITNPRNYDVVPIIELIDPERPITYGILKPGDDLADGVPYVRVLDMVDGSINFRGLRRTSEEISTQYRRSILQQGDLLMSIRGHVGRLATVSPEVAGANITQDTARLAIAKAEPAYVLECLRSGEVQHWMKVFTKGAAVRGINLTDVKKIPIPLPPKVEQERFARVMSASANKKSILQSSLAQLNPLFASLQQRAFRGDL